MRAEKKNAYSILVGKTEGKIPLRRPSLRGCAILNGSERDRMEWYGLGRYGSGWDQWRALVIAVMNLRVP
jgi:hypothetical protein